MALDADTTGPVLFNEGFPKAVIEDRPTPILVGSLASSFFSGELLAGEIGS